MNICGRIAPGRVMLLLKEARANVDCRPWPHESCFSTARRLCPGQSAEIDAMEREDKQLRSRPSGKGYGRSKSGAGGGDASTAHAARSHAHDALSSPSTAGPLVVGGRVAREAPRGGRKGDSRMPPREVSSPPAHGPRPGVCSNVPRFWVAQHYCTQPTHEPPGPPLEHGRTAVGFAPFASLLCASWPRSLCQARELPPPGAGPGHGAGSRSEEAISVSPVDDDGFTAVRARGGRR